MEGFTYNNIFETKGIEYLIVIGFFLVLIPFWLLLNRSTEISQQIKKGLGILTAGILRIPQGLFFSNYHTWAYLERSGNARVGMDDLLLHITGDVRVKDLHEKGTVISKGDKLAEIYQDGKAITISSPVSGEITAINPLITQDAGIINQDPYLKGWIYKIKPENWIAETGQYHLAGEATDWFSGEINRFRDFLARSVTEVMHGSSDVVLQDGGELVDNPLSRLPGEVWENFQKDFLNNGKILKS